MRTIISQLVSVMAFFKRPWSWTSSPNMFSFIMKWLVTSQLSCFRLIEIRRKRSSMKFLFYLISSCLSPNVISASSFWIQKYSLITKTFCSASLEPSKFTILSMMMNFACLLKLCLCYWNCLQATIKSGLCLRYSYLILD